MAPYATEETQLPVWVQLWFVVSGIICTWDASFVLLRPHSMPGGKYFTLFAPYKLYIQVDRRYGDLNDTFVVSQSLMNYAEILLGFIAVYLCWKRSRSAAPLAFTTATMTFWKTVLYLLQYVKCLVGGGEYHDQNTLMDNVLFLYIPSGIWIVVPFWIMSRLWGRMVNGPNVLRIQKND